MTTTRTPTALRTVLLGALLALAATGCLSVPAPDRFLVTSESSSEIQAVAADESRLLVREFADEHEGTLEFWVETLRNEFVGNRGYTLVEQGAVQDDRGRPGHEFVFEVGMGGATWGYLLVVTPRSTMTGQRIRCVEYVAETPRFEEHLSAVREVMGSVTP